MELCGEKLIDMKANPDFYDDAISHYGGSRYNDGVNTCIDVIEELPSAQPEHKWIPCSKRLPDSPKQVLVYARSVHYALAKYDEMREADGSYKKQWVTFDAWKLFYTIKEVIAWRPLPEPYQESEGGS